MATANTREDARSADDLRREHSEWLRLRREHQWAIDEHARLHDGVWHTELLGDIHFPNDAHDELFSVEDGSFWFRHRNRVIEQALRKAAAPSVLWEIGAGNGCVSHYLQQRGIPTVAVEPLVPGALNARRRGVEAIVCGAFESLRLPPDALPAVGCFDVLEHLEHPEALVTEINRTLRPGGVVIATVPALSWLWSEADTATGHFRRYTRGALNQLFCACGLEPVHSEYFMFAMVLPMLCLRTLPSLWRRDRDQRAALRRCRTQMKASRRKDALSLADVALRTEAAVAKVVPLPAGTSVLGVYRKAG